MTDDHHATRNCHHRRRDCEIQGRVRAGQELEMVRRSKRMLPLMRSRSQAGVSQGLAPAAFAMPTRSYATPVAPLGTILTATPYEDVARGIGKSGGEENHSASRVRIGRKKKWARPLLEKIDEHWPGGLSCRLRLLENREIDLLDTRVSINIIE